MGFREKRNSPPCFTGIGTDILPYMKLILINGPCGVGKSTIAEKLHEEMPLSYLVDIDAISRNISHYREFNEERRELRDAVAAATIEATLSVGRNVIIEKMIFDLKTLGDYEEIAKQHHADFLEIILWAEKEVVMQRASDRGWREGGLLTPEKCELFWERIDELRTIRKNAIFIDTSALNPNEVFETLKKSMNGHV